MGSVSIVFAKLTNLSQIQTQIALIASVDLWLNTAIEL